MATGAQLTAFINFLEAQANVRTIDGTTYGQPYVIGGQHLALTPSNYQAQINARESDTTYRAQAKAYCKRLFDAGETILYAYDCSGLGMYFWQNLEHEYPEDLNANGMMGKCNLYKDDPKRGWWVFKVNSNGRAYHIAYMVDNTHTIEAMGRRYGVVKREFKRSAWDKWGIPKILKEVIPAPGEPGHTWVHFMSNYIFYPGGNYFFPPH